MSIFLVQHGEAQHNGVLTPQGELQAQTAAELLTTWRGLGKNALVLSSEAFRAGCTAWIIAHALGTGVAYSPRLTLASENPQIVKELDGFLRHELAVCDVSDAALPPHDLVVVTHPPLMAVAKGLSPECIDAVNMGEVVEYEEGSWPDVYYLPHVERFLSASAGLRPLAG